MTFKIYNPHAKKAVWKSISASGFKPNGRSCKSDHFDIKHTGAASGEESYHIVAHLDKHVQFDLVFRRPAEAPGVKFGAGEMGGISTFGKDKEDGIALHRFLPLMYSSGTFTLDGKVVDAKGDGMFVRAIQGMRPDSLATRWNFAFFTTGGGIEEGPLGGVRAIQMEFETTDAYGPKGHKSGRTKVNVGVVTITSLPSPLIVVGQTHHASSDAFPRLSKDISAATHLGVVKDKDTGYYAPTGISFVWEGDRVDGKGRAGAKVVQEKAGATVGEGGLIEKVDVLGEIPLLIRKGLAAVTGTKPYIFQYQNPATLEVTLDGETTPVKGWLFDEATFISD
ncbi:hypothetical protein M231_05660 [Tremella mesenterica]|uniref:Survival factor 1 n=2 Tax=Tremella mesenterica TaxID=5217 RepID=A0A4Q1BHJ9_TREME|nr:hypothetical protein M231_05660 [Tremella mesenterica]